MPLRCYVPASPRHAPKCESLLMRISLRRIEQFIGLGVLIVLGTGCVIVLRPFLPALLWSTILSICTWPAFRWLEDRLNGRSTLAAAIMTATLALGLLVPLSILAGSVAENFSHFASRVLAVFENGPPPPPAWVGHLPIIGEELLKVWDGYAHDTARFVQSVSANLKPATAILFEVGSSIGHGILDLSLSVIVAFFFFRDGARVAVRLTVLIDKVAGTRGRRLLDVAKRTMIGVVYGILGTALLQGALAAVGMRFAGVPGPLFLGLLTTIVALVPMGPPLVWVPAILWLFSLDHTTQAIFLIIWAIVVIFIVDNIIRPYFISLGSSLPLLLVYLGVVGGIVAFGFIGLFLGPTLLAVAYTIIREWTHSEELDEGLTPAADI